MKLKYLKEDWWLYLSCYFTGYNYEMIRQSSELSKKHARKMFSALTLVMFIWGFIGYSFVNRYMHGNLFWSITGMLIMIFMVVQIERQIIMSVKRTKLLSRFRIAIALIIAFIGSVIIDQIIFKEDIEIAKQEHIQNKINLILPQKTNEIAQYVNDLKSQLANLENERTQIMKEVSQQPTIETARVNRSTSRTDTLTGKVESESYYQLARIPNPKIAYLSTIDKKINDLNNLISENQQRMYNIRMELENELKNSKGFLDEIQVMISILVSSFVSLIIWLLIFFFFLSIELFVLVNKFTDSSDDYSKMLIHQAETHEQKIQALKQNFL